MKRHLKETSDLYSFSFHVKPSQPPIEIRWRKEDGIAVIDAGIATILINHGHARNITDDELLRWNHMIDHLHPDALSPAPVVIPAVPTPLEEPQEATEQPKDAQEQPAATQTPAAQQNAPEGQETGSEGSSQQEQETTELNTVDENATEEGSTEETPEESPKAASKSKSKANKGLL